MKNYSFISLTQGSWGSSSWKMFLSRNSVINRIFSSGRGRWVPDGDVIMGMSLLFFCDGALHWLSVTHRLAENIQEAAKEMGNTFYTIHRHWFNEMMSSLFGCRQFVCPCVFSSFRVAIVLPPQALQNELKATKWVQSLAVAWFHFCALLCSSCRDKVINLRGLTENCVTVLFSSSGDKRKNVTEVTTYFLSRPPLPTPPQRAFFF